MQKLLIKDFPLELYQKLQERAAKNNCTIPEEVIHLIEMALRAEYWELPTNVQVRFPLTDEWIDRAKRERWA